MGTYSHLTRDDRDQIAGMLAAGLSQGQMAKAVVKSKSAISRELRRNALDGGGYSAAIADGSYVERRQRPATLVRDAELGLFVRQRPSEGLLSPIAAQSSVGQGDLPSKFPDGCNQVPGLDCGP